MLSFYKQQSHFSQIVSKEAKITISFLYEKFPKITILFWVLVFSFVYLVSVYPTNRIYTYVQMQVSIYKVQWIFDLRKVVGHL